MKKRGIFIKVFIYTMISMLLIVCVTVALFSQQVVLLYRTMQTRSIIGSYQPLINRIQKREDNAIDEMARDFYENNQSFEFYIVDKYGNPIYATPDADTSTDFAGDFIFVVHKDIDYSIVAQSKTGLKSFYSDIIARITVALIALTSMCVLCAYIFAQRMTKPIKWLVDDTGKMARFEDVPRRELPRRRDELGELSRDIYIMYDRLKQTIAKLKSEIQREREMEEAQRYFFSAASHELKTPIAATGILLEGMLANVGRYKDHPKYLRECIKLMDFQSKLVAEILGIVNLIDGKVIPLPQKLKLGDIVLSVLSDYNTLAESKKQRIFVEVSKEITVFADMNILKKILSNVVLNAIQNAPSYAEIRIWSDIRGDKIRLFVLNTDTHIDESILSKLFDPFYRAEKARSSKDKRSGLGLTIVEKSLKTMNAAFALENTPDGVSFWMDLPKI